MLQAELQSEVSSGAISPTDLTALSSALNEIDSSLQSGAGGSTVSSGASSSNAAPGDIKSKIDNLIAGEVSSGKLTAQQASELQGVFQNAFAGGANASSGTGSTDAVSALGAAPPPGGADSSGSVHHGHHGGGHHGASSASASSTSSSSSSTDGSSTTSSANDILKQFLQSLQDSLASSTSAAYAADGSSSDGSSSFSALLINYQT
jgi:hypothetical protein